MVFLMNKKGGVGSMLDMLLFLGAVTAIVVIVFGISIYYYDYNVSVRDSEARILGVKIMDCLVDGGVLDLDEVDENEYNSIFSYCGFEKSERVYIGVDVLGEGGKRIEFLDEGDSGLLWVRDLFGKGVDVVGSTKDWNTERVESIVEYNPGYFGFERLLFVSQDGKKVDGKVRVEVLINHEK